MVDAGDASAETTVNIPSTAVPAAVVATLNAAPVFVHPDVDLSVTASATVMSSTGGDVALDLGSGANVKLHIPAGAFPEDETVSLTAITGVDGAPALGVAIEPSGVEFPIDRFPTLTVTELPDEFTSKPVFLADQDGVVQRADMAPGVDSATLVVLPHFSDVFFTDDITTLPITPFDEGFRGFLDPSHRKDNDRTTGNPPPSLTFSMLPRNCSALFPSPTSAPC